MMNREQSKKLVIFIDSGDTIIDESTEIRDENGIVIHAEPIEGAAETLKALYEAGYTIALVADGEYQSFENVYTQNGLKHCFKTWTVSEIVGKQKPAAVMFEDAMKKNSLTEEDKKRIVMIGNNLKKDIVGANRFGITSILMACPRGITCSLLHPRKRLIILFISRRNCCR
ncbi:HAD family hydrolase [Thermoclostridium stercorarium]|uniref:HAD family hydrolase n=1 Tax=Thermoclostridium stercorarium TaxID=1510 RepID=UPI0020938149|nr:HAD hydrolase-like protein [Thermoclostridium stercorarium]